jgi:hypothetical protein
VDWVARLGSTVDRGSADKMARRCVADARRAGARAHWCSLAMAEEEEPVEVVLEAVHRSTSSYREAA